MGTVKTTLRHIGKAGRDSPLAVSGRSIAAFWSSSSLKGSVRRPFSAVTSEASLHSTTKTSRLSDARTALASDSVGRWKSTMASFSESDDEDESNTHAMEYAVHSNKMSHNGHAAAAKAHVDSSSTLDDSWRINLGRGDNNKWLTGPRDEDDWFTGLKPSICPGADSMGKIRSLSLPRLDAVTREAAKEYFDNSWTLYETLFAGLNGEEYFYR